LHLLPWTFDKEIIRLIRSGNVAYELVRPLDLYWLWFSRACAIRLIPTLLRALPLFFIAWLFLGLSFPVSFPAFCAFLLSLCFSMFLAASITTLVILSLFWTISGEGIQRLVPGLTIFLSGVLVPLPLFPDWMQLFLSAQPIRGIIDIPSRIYTGVIQAGDILYYVAFQLAWCLFFVLVGRWCMQKATKSIIIQGG
jgi:ABC-2 type transport system permease protein